MQTKLSGRSNIFSWTTMPEMLSRKGDQLEELHRPEQRQPRQRVRLLQAVRSPARSTPAGLAPTYSQDFLSDLSSGKLPQVSWLTPGISDSEHPGFSSPQAGELAVAQVMKDLLAHPDVWRKTALFITWDENGGFFDHVPPPTPPPGTKDEFLTVGTLPSAAGGIRGPIGLGFRVPMLVVSPFSRGGLVSSDTFDHTSTLRFLETRFGARVPNLSAWRRKTTGDLTSAFNFAAKPNASAAVAAAAGQHGVLGRAADHRQRPAVPPPAEGQAAAAQRDRVRSERTQVAIVGAGPAGLLLGRLLHRAGHRLGDPRDALARSLRGADPGGDARAGHRRRAARGRRGRAAGPRGPGPRRDPLNFGGERHRIPITELTGGRTVTVYGQTEIVKDLIAAHLA